MTADDFLVRATTAIKNRFQIPHMANTGRPLCKWFIPEAVVRDQFVDSWIELFLGPNLYWGTRDGRQKGKGAMKELGELGAVHRRTYARTTGMSSQRVVYCGVRRSWRIDQVLMSSFLHTFLSPLIPALASCKVPRP